MLKENCFYNDGKRDLCYIGDDPIPQNHLYIGTNEEIHTPKFNISKFISYVQKQDEEFIEILRFDSGLIETLEDNKIRLPSPIHIWRIDSKKDNNKFKHFRKVYEDTLENYLEVLN